METTQTKSERINERRKSYKQVLRENLKFQPRTWDSQKLSGAPFQQQLRKLQPKASKMKMSSTNRSVPCCMLHSPQRQGPLALAEVSAEDLAVFAYRTSPACSNLLIFHGPSNYVWSKGEPCLCYEHPEASAFLLGE